MMSASPLDFVRQFVINFERKQRNLGKRKSKLDSYRDKLAKGETLNEEQRKAVDGYDGVLQSINVVQEVISQTKELLNDVEEATRVEQDNIESAHEKYTISFLHTHACLMRLLTSLDSPSVRLAIARSSSENHLKLLDGLRGLVTAPLLDNWPGTSASSLANAPTFLQNHQDLDDVARNNFNFVMGKTLPVPFFENQSGHKKHFNFRDARNLCFRLLATPTVQRAMGAHSRANSVVSSVAEEQIRVEEEKQPIVSSEGGECRCETIDSYLPVETEASLPTALNAPFKDFCGRIDDPPLTPVVDHVIKPLGGTFNFIQASNVTPNIATQPIMNPGLSDKAIQPTEVGPHQSLLNGVNHEQEDLPIPDPDNNYLHQKSDELSTNFEVSTEPQQHDIIHERQVLNNSPQPDCTKDEDTAVWPSTKPISYADLVKRPSHTRTVTHNQRISGVTDVGKTGVNVNESQSDTTPNMTPTNQENYSKPGYPRGRMRTDFRGGRGGPNPSRGNFGGTQRRGQRGRFDSNRGGNGPYRGISTSVPQPTC